MQYLARWGFFDMAQPEYLGVDRSGQIQNFESLGLRSGPRAYKMRPMI